MTFSIKLPQTKSYFYSVLIYSYGNLNVFGCQKKLQQNFVLMNFNNYNNFNFGISTNSFFWIEKPLFSKLKKCVCKLLKNVLYKHIFGKYSDTNCFKRCIFKYRYVNYNILKFKRNVSVLLYALVQNTNDNLLGYEQKINLDVN